MLKTIDRIQLAVPDATEAAQGWAKLLGAEFGSRDRVNALAANRTTYRLGRSVVEFLEPDGAGPIDAALKRRGRGHLYAGGISTDDFDTTVAGIRATGIEPAIENGAAYFNAKGALGVDCPLVVNAAEDRPVVGLIDFLYEVTLLTDDVESVTARFAGLFGLNDTHFVPIGSDKFDYRGVLTLFSPDDLHRFEVIRPHSNASTMGRFFERQGDSFYMCFAESPHMLEIEARAKSAGAGITVDTFVGKASGRTLDQMWIHPPALGGVMLGLSRPTMAWTWSGHPERVRSVE